MLTLRRAAVERTSLVFARRLLVETASFKGSIRTVVESAAALAELHR
jgi:hypothetical protein